MRDGLRNMRMVHVLNFEGLRPGAFGGFGSREEDAKFDALFENVMRREAKWCCRCGIPCPEPQPPLGILRSVMLTVCMFTHDVRLHDLHSLMRC